MSSRIVQQLGLAGVSERRREKTFGVPGCLAKTTIIGGTINESLILYRSMLAQNCTGSKRGWIMHGLPDLMGSNSNWTAPVGVVNKSVL